MCAQTFLCSNFFFLQFTSTQISLLDRKCIISQKFSSTWRKVHDFLAHLWKWILVEKKNHLKRRSLFKNTAISFDVRSSLHEFLLSNFPCMTHKSKHSWWPKDPEKNREINFLEQKLSFCFCYFVKVRWEPIIRVLMYWLLTYN